MARKSEAKQAGEAKWFRIQRDDDITFTLFEREGDKERIVSSDTLAIILGLANENIMRELGLC